VTKTQKESEVVVALRLALELIEDSDTRYFIGKKLGEMARLHTAINAGRKALRT